MPDTQSDATNFEQISRVLIQNHEGDCMLTRAQKAAHILHLARLHHNMGQVDQADLMFAAALETALDTDGTTPKESLPPAERLDATRLLQRFGSPALATPSVLTS